MLWSEQFHALVGENQKAEDVAGPPLAEILSVLYAGLGHKWTRCPCRRYPGAFRLDALAE